MEAPTIYTTNDRQSFIAQKQASRVAYHISSYIQLRVQVQGVKPFKVTTSKKATIEELASLIEAEYAFQFDLCESASRLKNLVLETTEDVSKAFEFEPLVCGAILYDGKELSFHETVGSTLPMGATVEVVNHFTRSGYITNLSTPSLSLGSIKSFRQLLLQPSFLMLFEKFCRSCKALHQLAFFLEVEIFRKEGQPITTASYLYNCFIDKNAPLKLNFYNEVTQQIPDFSRSSITKLDSNIFDLLQHHVYQNMKINLFPTFLAENPNLNLQTLDKALIFQTYIANKELKATLSALELTTSSLDRHLRGRSWFIERLLEKIIGQFIPFPSLSEYCNESLTTPGCSKAAKMKKYNLFIKFFGEPPSDEQLRNQSEASGITLTPNLSNTCIDTSDSEDYVKISDKKTKNLKVLLGKEVSKDYDLPSAYRQSSLFSSHNNESNSTPTYQSPSKLSKQERKVLIKRLKKLKLMLGEDITQSIVNNKTNSYHSDYHSSNDHSYDDEGISSQSETEFGQLNSFKADSDCNDGEIVEPTVRQLQRKRLRKLVDILGGSNGLYAIQKEVPLDQVLPKIQHRRSSTLPSDSVRINLPKTRMANVRSNDKVLKVLGSRPKLENIPNEVPARHSSDEIDLDIDVYSTKLSNHSSFLPAMEDMHGKGVSLPQHWLYNTLRSSDFHQSDDLDKLQHIENIVTRRRLSKISKFFGEDVKHDKLVVESLGESCRPQFYLPRSRSNMELRSPTTPNSPPFPYPTITSLNLRPRDSWFSYLTSSNH